MTLVIAIVVGLAVGFFLGMYRPAKARARGRAHPVGIGGGSQTAHPLADLVEAVRAAALRVEPRLDGFDLVDQLTSDDPPDRLSVRVVDPKAVTLDSIRCADTASIDLAFYLALALVPLYGPITLSLDSGVYTIDGTKDRHALIRELSRRQTARMVEVLAKRQQAR